MRLGGAFPFNAAGTFPVSLGGGGYFYLPPGNYLITLGAQSVLQWWDPYYGWRAYGTPGETFPVSVDGYNYRIANLSGVAVGAAITNAGSGGVNGIGPTQTGTTVAFSAPGGNGQAAKGYAIIGGSLPALSIAVAGSGFVVPPLILIDPPPLGGIQATATAQITSAGALASVTLNNAGAGYLSLPNVYVVPQFLDYSGAPALPYTIPSAPTPVAPNFPPGSYLLQPPAMWTYGITPAFPVTGGASVNFGAGTLGGSGTLTGLVVTDFGSLYTAAATISFAGGTLAGGVAATAIMSFSLTALTGSGGVAYTVGNPWISDIGLINPIGAGYTGYYDNNFLPQRPARGRLTSTAGAVAIEDAGFGFQQALVAGNFGVALGGSIPTTTVTFSGITMGGVVDTSIIQGSINE